MDPTKPAPRRISELLESIEAPTLRSSNSVVIPKPGLSARAREKAREQARQEEEKMDPFEVRIRFTQYLQHLNASVTSANKTAQFALKYRDMDEDLHSCILEQLEKVGS